MLALLPNFIVFVGSGFLFSGIYMPSMVVMSYLIFRPLIQPFAWLQYKLFGLPIALPFSLIVIALGILFSLIGKRWNPIVGKSEFFNLFMVIAILSIGVSNYFQESMAGLIKLLTVWFLFAFAYNSVDKEDDAIRIIDSLILSSVVPLAFGFYEAITGNYDILLDSEVDRIASVFVTGNDYGIFLTFLTAVCAIRLSRVNSRNVQRAVLVILLMVLVSQVLSLNRGTWLALTIGFVLAAAKYNRFFNFKPFLAGATVFLVIFSGTIADRFSELSDPSSVHYDKTSTLEGRFNYWQAITPLIVERPILGYGLGTGSLVTKKHLGTTNKPHNDYVHISLEMGIFAALAYIGFLIRILVYFFTRPIIQDLWIWNFSLLMLSTYFIIISMTQNIVQTTLNFPIFMILVAVVLKLNRNFELENNPIYTGKGRNNSSNH